MDDDHYQISQMESQMITCKKCAEIFLQMRQKGVKMRKQSLEHCILPRICSETGKYSQYEEMLSDWLIPTL